MPGGSYGRVSLHCDRERANDIERHRRYAWARDASMGAMLRLFNPAKYRRVRLVAEYLGRYRLFLVARVHGSGADFLSHGAYRRSSLHGGRDYRYSDLSQQYREQ